MNISSHAFVPHGVAPSIAGYKVNIFNPWNWSNNISLLPFPNYGNSGYAIRRFSTTSTIINQSLPFPYLPYFAYKITYPFILILY